MNGTKITVEDGRIILELEATIRIPVEFEAVMRRVVPENLELTPREQQVLGGILAGLANKEIGSQLNIAARTVKFHVGALLKKFRVDSRQRLVALVKLEDGKPKIAEAAT